MSVFLFKVAAALFALKLLWNVLVPYCLLVDTGDEARGVSLMTFVEITLLGIAVVLSLLAGFAWPWSPGGVALFGSAAIIGSYALLVISSVVLRISWLRACGCRGSRRART